nr:GNAT family N-acetyltransferase [uncultured Actinoplanes sp.]
MPILTDPALPPGSMAALAQPDIAAEGLLLRPWRLSDRRPVLAGFADPDIQRWHVRSMDDDEVDGWITSWAARWRAESAANWAITRDGEVAGQIGLRRIDLVEGLAAVSYWVLPAARGERVASRALVALTGWSFDRLGLHRIEVSHSTANPASCRVAERGGFLAEGTKRSEARHADGWHDMHLHARIRTDSP